MTVIAAMTTAVAAAAGAAVAVAEAATAAVAVAAAVANHCTARRKEEVEEENFLFLR